MTFAVEVAGRARTIEVRRSGDRWLVTVDGRPVAVDVAMAGGRVSLLLDTRSYEVAVDLSAGASATAERRDAGAVVVHVNGRAVPVVLGRRGAASVASGGAGGLAAGPAVILAPMPGRVVKLLANAGDQVTARQGVIVVEAMKMENELRAPKAGTVRELRVAEGALVEAGATLAVIE